MVKVCVICEAIIWPREAGTGHTARVTCGEPECKRARLAALARGYRVGKDRTAEHRRRAQLRREKKARERAARSEAGRVSVEAASSGQGSSAA